MIPAADARLRMQRRVRLALPEGRQLNDVAWWPRHRSMLLVLWGHVTGLLVWWAVVDQSLLVLRGITCIALAAAVASTTAVRRRVRAIAVTLGLLGCSALLLALTQGATEMHFHFFVVLALVTLYQDWLPFLLTVTFVLGHHAVCTADLGAAVKHSSFVAAVGLVHLLTWRLYERAGAHAEQALSATGEGIYGIDEKGIITFANPAAARLVGRTVADLVGTHHHTALGHALVGAGHPAVEECATCAVVDAHTGVAVREHLFGADDGDGIPVELVSTPIELRGDVTGSMVAYRDLTDHAELQRRAYRDPLTGLPNRTLLLDHLDDTLARKRRHDSVAVLFLDLDHFKAVNDSLGHAAGDTLLVGVAERLRQVVRPSDTVGRLGGDEFVVVCEGVTDRDHAAGVAHRVLAGFAEPFDIGRDDPVVIRPSIGVFVPSVDTPNTPDDFLRKADAAMYRAKQHGRGRVELFDDEALTGSGP